MTHLRAFLVRAPALTNLFRVNASSADFSGIVRCETVIANDAVASSYTPGEGDVW